MKGANERTFRKLEGNPYLRIFNSLQATENFAGEEKQLWLWRCRRRLVKVFAWAIPCDGALDRLAGAGEVIEIGCGRGYWAGLVKARGGDIYAYDAARPSGSTYFPIATGGPGVLSGRRVDSLFLCWPPLGSTMAAEALTQFKGRSLFYVGEAEGGCTGDRQFHRLLSEQWGLVSRLDIPRWPGVNDSFFEYRRA